MCNNEITQFYLQPPTHEPYLPNPPPQPQGVTAIWLVLIVATHEGMARLSLSGWLVTYRDKFPAPRNPDKVTHSSTNRTRRRLTSLSETKALPLSQTTTIQTSPCPWILTGTRPHHIGLASGVHWNGSKHELIWIVVPETHLAHPNVNWPLFHIRCNN